MHLQLSYVQTADNIITVSITLKSYRRYTQMPKQHQSKAVKQVFNELERLGFTVEHKKSGSYRIVPPQEISGRIYNTHGTESCLHPLRRDFKKMYGINLNI